MTMVKHMTLLQTFVSNTYYRGKQYANKLLIWVLLHSVHCQV